MASGRVPCKGARTSSVGAPLAGARAGWVIVLACLLCRPGPVVAEPAPDATHELKASLDRILEDLRNGAPEEKNATPAPEVAEAEPISSPVTGATAKVNGAGLRIRPGQMLTVIVTVAGEKEVEDLGKRVNSEGEATFSLVGTVPVSGRTLSELQEELTGLYQRFLRAPLVEVSYEYGDTEAESGATSPWGTVTVLGRVREPGRINIPPTQDLTVSMAIQEAGGFDSSAREKAITVTRKNEDGSTKRMRVDMRAVATKRQPDPVLQDQDVIFVPERMF
jgi:protein involved in polysaccharide export with SLBB domain